VSNSKHDLDTKIYSNPHKLVIKHIISIIRTQVDNNVETLNFINIEANLNLILIVLYFYILLSLEANFLFIV
jgi:hypothetical protein